MTVQSIICTVAKHYDVTPAQIVGPRRVPLLVRVRHIAMYIAREMTGRSYPQLGKAFSRDHTSVLHACRVIRAAILSDGELAYDVKRIMAALGTGAELAEHTCPHCDQVLDPKSIKGRMVARLQDEIRGLYDKLEVLAKTA